MSLSMPRWLIAVLAVAVTGSVWFTLSLVTGRANPFSSSLILPCGHPVQGNITSMEQVRQLAKQEGGVFITCTHGHYFDFKDNHWVGPLNSGMSQTMPGYLPGDRAAKDRH